jgi:putative ABC transport system ATP-binding protein
MSLIEIRNISKRYHKGDETITPLDGVSLDIEQGEFLSLMGASGTGKSTLLNLIASIDRPDSGTIVVDGTDITRLSRTKLANWRAANMGYIFQTHNLVPVLTAYENIELPLLLLPMSRRERRKRIEIALQAVDLIDHAKCRVDRNNESALPGPLSLIRKWWWRTNRPVTWTRIRPSRS